MTRPGTAILFVVSALAVPAMGQFDLQLVQTYVFEEPIYPTSLDLGDFDGDGRPDLVMSGRNEAALMVLMHGTDEGLFGAPEFLHFGRHSNWVTASDFDGNGTLDFAVAVRGYPGEVALLRGNGDGTFMSPERHPVGRDPVQMVAADFDADGATDLAITNHRSNDVSILRNLGDGAFETVATVPLTLGLTTSARPYSIAQDDLDGDGDRDLAVACLTSGHVAVLPNLLERGAGLAFGGAVRVPVEGAASLAIGDVIGDGGRDVLGLQFTQGGGVLTLLSNSGGLQFERVSTDPFGGFVWYLGLIDIDGDTAPDALVSDALDALVYIHRNLDDGSGGLAVETILPAGGFPRMIVPYDYDQDCDWDLVIIDIALHRLQVWRNDTPQLGGCASRDLDRDGIVGFGDLLILLGAWGDSHPPADFNYDGVVDFSDLLTLLGAWGT